MRCCVAGNHDAAACEIFTSQDSAEDRDDNELDYRRKGAKSLCLT